MNALEERLRTGLAAEADAWPDPPAPGATHRSSTARGLGVALIAAAAVFVVIGGFAVADRLASSEQKTLDAAAPPAVATPNPYELPRFTLELDGWSVLDIVDVDTETIAIFTQDGGDHSAAIHVRANFPGEPPGSTHQAVLEMVTGVSGEPIAEVDIDDETTALAFVSSAGAETPGPLPTYHFVWTDLSGISMEVVLSADSLETAKAVLAGVSPISETSWQRLLDEYQDDKAPDSSTTTLPPTTTTLVGDFGEAIVEHPVTLSDGTDVTISLLVAEGSDLPVLWSAGLSRGAYDEQYASAPFSALVHIWFFRNADDVVRELEETERLSGSVLLTDDRYIVDHDGHAYDFQFGDGDSGPDLPQEILDEWVSAITIDQSPDSILPIVTVDDTYEVTYGPSRSFEGIYIDGEPVVVGITEGCEVEPGAPVEHATENRASIQSCVLDGRVELLVSGSLGYVERTRSHEFVRITKNP